LFQLHFHTTKQTQNAGKAAAAELDSSSECARKPIAVEDIRIE